MKRLTFFRNCAFFSVCCSEFSLRMHSDITCKTNISLVRASSPHPHEHVPAHSTRTLTHTHTRLFPLADDNKYHCSRCEARQDGVISHAFERLPDRLNFHIMRFSMDLRTARRSKLNTVRLSMWLCPCLSCFFP